MYNRTLHGQFSSFGILVVSPEEYAEIRQSAMEDPRGWSIDLAGHVFVRTRDGRTPPHERRYRSGRPWDEIGREVLKATHGRGGVIRFKDGRIMRADKELDLLRLIVASAPEPGAAKPDISVTRYSNEDMEYVLSQPSDVQAGIIRGLSWYNASPRFRVLAERVIACRREAERLQTLREPDYTREMMLEAERAELDYRLDELLEASADPM